MGDDKTGMVNHSLAKRFDARLCDSGDLLSHLYFVGLPTIARPKRRHDRRLAASRRSHSVNDPQITDGTKCDHDTVGGQVKLLQFGRRQVPFHAKAVL
jgi:hypothetical protein